MASGKILSQNKYRAALAQRYSEQQLLRSNDDLLDE
jgi:hypothetical protein